MTDAAPAPEVELEIDIIAVPSMLAADRDAIFEVFDRSYRDGNHDYLQRSLDRIGLVALARLEGRGVAYSISQSRWMALPGFDDPQLVVLHGMRCVVPEFRHRGVNVRMNRAISDAMDADVAASGRTPERRLACGRHGHASRAGAATNPLAIPRPGLRPTAWQQAVGLTIADAYGSTLDPETFVCIGSGQPIGYPNEEFEPTPAEAEAYALVNRDRGDNLLVINWMPDLPPGWNDPTRVP